MSAAGLRMLSNALRQANERAERWKVRADEARAERDAEQDRYLALRERIEALASKWDREPDDEMSAGWAADALRAALDEL